jgi:GTPase SAR1 family protein
VDLAALLAARVPDTVHYTNAKVVLVGDTSVGKTGLGLVLTGKPFKATESTHGRFVLVFDSAEMPRQDGLKELRETLLWDLAGQPGYRMIHQLHLDDVVVALVVFDARSETEPFSGVRYWARALRLAQRLQGSSATPMKKLLVAARADRGGVGVSKERTQAMARELGFDGYVETSAKEGWGIKDLRDAIRQSIQWEHLPTVSSTALFISVKNFLIDERRSERFLSVDDDLFRAFSDSKRSVVQTDALRSQFATCLGRLEAQGLVRRLSFGNLILLKPELLDGYASMLVNAAKDEPDGLGSLAVEDVFASKFRMDESERLQNRELEKLLLFATAEELLDREIALKVTSADGAYFVFPSQLTRERPEITDPAAPAVIFSFQGPVLNIYATLAVRLTHSDFFQRDQMWKNAASYRSRTGGNCGMFVRELDEAHGELTLFFDSQISEEMRFLFEEFVHMHLLRRALGETVTRRRIFVCDECSLVVTDQLQRLRRDRGFDWVDCPVCFKRVSLLDRQERLDAARVAGIPEMDQAADAAREREVSELIIEGKGETRQFDVFLAHKSSEKHHVARIAEHLKKRRLNPWLDKEQIPPGRWFQDLIQRAIPNVRSAAICIGSGGLGKWQAIELRAFVSQCVERSLPVIPVLLPGVSDIPGDLAFLRELSWVRFSKTVNDQSALDDLVWGITGKHPGSQSA